MTSYFLVRTTARAVQAYGEADAANLKVVPMIIECGGRYLAKGGRHQLVTAARVLGPVGFLKVLDDRTLAFVDYARWAI